VSIKNEIFTEERGEEKEERRTSGKSYKKKTASRERKERRIPDERRTHRVQVLVREVHRQTFQVEYHLSLSLSSSVAVCVLLFFFYDDVSVCWLKFSSALLGDLVSSPCSLGRKFRIEISHFGTQKKVQKKTKAHTRTS
jgi:hypothetical protein